jgi:hypothetical protein
MAHLHKCPKCEEGWACWQVECLKPLESPCPRHQVRPNPPDWCVEVYLNNEFAEVKCFGTEHELQHYMIWWDKKAREAGARVIFRIYRKGV